MDADSVVEGIVFISQKHAGGPDKYQLHKTNDSCTQTDTKFLYNREALLKLFPCRQTPREWI